MDAIVPILVGLFGGGALVALVVFLNPDKIEKWASLGWRAIYALFKRGQRAYVTHDIQGRVNSFAASLNREAPYCEAVGVKLEWVDADDDVSSFVRDGRLVVRMRQAEDEEKNFVNASMVFVSKALVPKAKKYLSPTQRQSIDLFVGKRLFEEQKPQVLDRFFEDHFSPSALGNEKIQVLLDDFAAIDKVGLFFCVLVRDLSFLGEKVFLGPRDERIIDEVGQLIAFLRTFADRELGAHIPLQLVGAYCRSGMVIVARRFKRELGETRPYINWVGRLVESRIEQVYLLGSAEPENRDFIDAIAAGACERYNLEIYDRRSFTAAIRVADGGRQKVLTHLVLLRSADVVRVYDREYLAQFVGEPTVGDIPDADRDREPGRA